MPEQHDAVEVISAKRDKGALSDSQIDWVIDAYTRGDVADEQMSALAMAILLNGMDRREIARWTGAMIASGERMDFSSLSRPTADKHSTGGVGDKITLPLAPLVAACGVAVPQLSGRGLGHTGGTLDKLESIPGWRAALSNDEMLAQLESVGAVICAAGDGLAPADKKLYALRDVTGTVEAIPLIASSIMSKKIAEGTGALVLDVKVGTGAFMKDADSARELAETMVALGTDAGVHTVALLTDMSTPLGLTAGNALEVRESVEVLAGGGPADVVELTLALAREMLAGAGRDDVDPAEVLASGKAMDAWRAMIEAQDGDPSAALPVAKETHDVPAPATGVLTRLDAMAVGLAAWRLGAGRARKEDPVQAGAGVVWHARPGDEVREGEPLLTLHTDEPRPLRAGAGVPRGRVRRVTRPLVVPGAAAGDRPRRLKCSLRCASRTAEMCLRSHDLGAEMRISMGPEAHLNESGEQQHDRLGDAGRLVLALDLDREAHRELVTGGHLDDPVDLGGGPDLGSDLDRVGEPHLVHAVVQLGARVGEREELAAEERDQRQGQVAVRDRAAERPLGGPLPVHVDPLVVVGRVRELVDAVLRDLDPLRGADLLADGRLDLLHGAECAHVTPRLAGWRCA